MSSTDRERSDAPGAPSSREQILYGGAQPDRPRSGSTASPCVPLAEELNCGTMTLYSHVSNRDDLLAGIVGLVIESLDLRYVPGESWQDCARRTVQSYRALAHEHFQGL